ncbi:MAG TPA: PAS domain S-box protein [Bryobacteraceae bacterium]|nr:PAS domain S-box protein [Bryobacteraceae bacterium]
MSITVFLAGLLAGGTLSWYCVSRARKERFAAATPAAEWRDGFLNALPLAVIGVDARGVVTCWNSAAETVFGWTAAETIGRPLPIVPKEEWRLFESRLGAGALRTWTPGVERQAVRKDGTRVEIAVWTAPAPETVHDSTVVLGIIDDISGRRQQEQRLRESEQRYRDLFENARDIVCTTDLECNFTSINRAGVEISGYSRDEYMKMNLADIIAADDLALTRRAVERRVEALASGAPLPDQTFRMRVKLKGGRFIHADARPRIYFQDGRPVGFHVVVRDITEQKRWEDALEQKNRELSDALEAARQATEVKSRFLANMSHEIRTPMNGVIATSELLADTELNAAQQEYVDMIRSSAQSLLRVINDILDISKIEAGKLELVPAPFDVAAIVGEVESFLRVQAAGKGLELHSEVDAAVPKRVRGDAGRLRQILLNLAGNAVKFTDKGGVVIRAALDSDSPGQAVVRFTVTDSGIGIAEQDAGHLFQSFVQADNSPARRYNGTGLGLAISKQLIELMGGSIGLESKPGCGSTFWFTARFETAEAAAEPGDAAAACPAAMTFPGTAVLVAEDNGVNRTIATRMLERLGCSVDAVADGRQAVDAAAQRRYDLIFMDGQMPVLDGLAAARQIRTAEAGGSHTPIVAVTASAMVGDRERCLEAGMDDYLTKPLALDKISAMLRRWTGTRPA